MNKIYFYNTLVGNLAIITKDLAVTHISWCGRESFVSQEMMLNTYMQHDKTSNFKKTISKSDKSTTKKTSANMNESAFILEETSLHKRTIAEVTKFLNGQLKEFTVAIKPKGTDFQLKIWDLLKTIPYGKIKTYGDIAKQIGNPKGPRAVGMACNKNPILFIIPCHRVVGSNGSLTGFACGIDMKEQLLNLERN